MTNQMTAVAQLSDRGAETLEHVIFPQLWILEIIKIHVGV